MQKPTAAEICRNFLRERRLAQGLTQEALALKVFGNAHDRHYISKIESGKRNINITTLGHLLTALNAEIKFEEY